MFKRISWFLLLVTVVLLMGCSVSPTFHSEASASPEFAVRYLPVQSTGNSYGDPLEVVEIRGHGHICYVLRTSDYGNKTNLWCEQDAK